MKMDEGTLVAILNVAASTADVKLAHVTWGLLKRSLAQATPWDTRSPTSKAAAAAASLRAATHPTAGDAPPELSLHPFDDGKHPPLAPSPPRAGGPCPMCHLPILPWGLNRTTRTMT